MDHGGEFTSTHFSTYLLHHSIHHQFSCPHTPEQNGVVECKNRHLLETARTLLHHASLPPPFWLEAASTATYLINRLPTKTLLQTIPPTPLIPPQNFWMPFLSMDRLYCNNKLDPKSSSCIFLGYSSYHKGFRCFDPITSKIIISRHVCFNEHEFSMAKQPTIPPPPQISTIHNPLSPLFTPTFYPSSPPSTSSPHWPPIPTPPNIPPPARKTDIHIQYQRRRPHSTTLLTIQPTPPPSSPYPHHPPHLH